jgi:serine/threonine protein kinase
MNILGVALGDLPLGLVLAVGAALALELLALALALRAAGRRRPILPAVAAPPPAFQWSRPALAVVRDRYRLLEEIGKGGMSTVYKALDLRREEAGDPQPLVALKMLNESLMDPARAVRTLWREARNARALAHPNIVQVIDYDRDGEAHFIIMELLDGQSLTRILREVEGTGLPPGRAFPIIEDIGRALAHAHARGLVHGDFKPSNAMLTRAGTVKLLDFGVARPYLAEAAVELAAVGDQSDPFVALTPPYASPEMLEGDDPDPRDDVFALALVSYQLLSGRHPLDRVSAVEARDAGMRPARIDTLSRGSWRALEAALAFDRDARTESVEEFVAKLTGRRQTS